MTPPVEARPLPTPPPVSEMPQSDGPALPAQVTGIIGSLGRLADLQLAIWLASIKSALLRIVIFLTLCLLMVPLLLAGLVFFYAGIYHVLTDVLGIPTAWSLLLFATLHFLLAGVLGFVAMRQLAAYKSRAKNPENTP